MKLHILACALVALGLAGAPAHAATAKKTTTTKKAATKKKAPTKKKTTAKKKTPAAPAQPALGEEQIALSKRVHTGKITCAAGQSVTITPDAANQGYFRVVSGKQSYTMHPVQTTSGALRLEDAKAGAVWLQLGSKSMLMNQKLGRRVADECTSPEQRAYAAEKKSNPAPSLFDPDTGKR